MPVMILKPACKDYIWGGRRLIEEFGKSTDKPRMAESRELSCHPDGLSVIDGGEHIACKKGGSIFLPAFSGNYEVTGNICALVTSVGTV